MSKIGRKPITIEEGVTIDLAPNHLKIAGPKGEFEFEVPRKLKLQLQDKELIVSRVGDDKESRALHGLWRMLVFNAIRGVSIGWEKKLDFKGVGFRAEVQDKKLILNVGFSHSVEKTAPEGVEFTVAKNIITVSGADKQKVGQAAAEIRKIRPVEPYKGKGIKYLDEIPRKKLGKAAKAATAA